MTVAPADSSHDRPAVNAGSHLATLRLMRAAAVGDNARALDEAIAVLARRSTHGTDMHCARCFSPAKLVCTKECSR